MYPRGDAHAALAVGFAASSRHCIAWFGSWRPQSRLVKAGISDAWKKGTSGYSNKLVLTAQVLVLSRSHCCATLGLSNVFLIGQSERTKYVHPPFFISFVDCCVSRCLAVSLLFLSAVVLSSSLFSTLKSENTKHIYGGSVYSYNTPISVVGTLPDRDLDCFQMTF